MADADMMDGAERRKVYAGSGSGHANYSDADVKSHPMPAMAEHMGHESEEDDEPGDSAHAKAMHMAGEAATDAMNRKDGHALIRVLSAAVRAAHEHEEAGEANGDGGESGGLDPGESGEMPAMAKHMAARKAKE